MRIESNKVGRLLERCEPERYLGERQTAGLCAAATIREPTPEEIAEREKQQLESKRRNTAITIVNLAEDFMVERGYGAPEALQQAENFVRRSSDFVDSFKLPPQKVEDDSEIEFL